MIALRALGVAAALILVWQASIIVFQPPPFMLPSPARVFDALIGRPDLWQVHAPATLLATLAGLFLGVAVGAGLALAMSFLPVTRRFLLPAMVVSQAIPVFAIAPLLVLWFGFGLTSKIVMTTIAIFFPVASAFADGLMRADPGLIDLARLYRANRWREVTIIRMPGAAVADHRREARGGVRAGGGADRRMGRFHLGLATRCCSPTPAPDRCDVAALALVVAMSVILRALVDLATANLAPWAPEIESTERRE